MGHVTFRSSRGGGLLAALMTAAAAHASIVYVDDDAVPGGDGTTWAGALVHLADALEAAAEPGSPIDVIRVAGGTYRPDRSVTHPLGSGVRSASFAPLNGVRLEGGYAGLGGADPDERDPDVFVTILSGDLAGDDGPGFTGNDENSLHVVVASGVDASAVIAGCTITAGHADGTADGHCFGGDDSGLPCGDDDDCTGAPCVSLDSTGAGVVAVGGAPTLEACRIVDNFAAFQGAGIMLKAGSHATIVDCFFGGNRALDNGGAMYLGLSRPLVSGCTFQGNTAGNYAGASCNRDWSDATFLNCLFVGNTAAESLPTTGGGAIVNASSSPHIIGCTFQDNDAIEGKGGAIYNKTGFEPELGPSAPLVEQCLFEQNTAARHGGAVYNEESSSATVTGCTLLANEADLGGGLYAVGGTAFDVQDTHFEANVATLGAGAFHAADAVSTYASCTFDGNTATMGAGIYDAGAISVSGCDFRNNIATRGAGLYNENGDAIVEGSSFLSNEATSSYAGGFYNQNNTTATIADCIFLQNTSDSDGGALYGHAMTLSVTGCTFISNHGEDGGGAGFAGVDLAMRDCVFRNNHATKSGGGMSLSTTKVSSIVDCSFVDNTAADHGAGLYQRGGAVTLRRLLVTGNEADNLGGGIKLENCDVVLCRSTIADNRASFGGGVHFDETPAVVTNVVLRGNFASDWGGGMYGSFIDDLEMTNSLVSGNLADRGGGVHIFRSDPSITNCTIAINTALDRGGGIYNQTEAFPLIRNCILWGNADSTTSGQDAQLHHFAGSVSTVHYSSVQGWTGDLGGEGNMGSDPQFVDPIGPDGVGGTDDDDLRLAPGSPCADAGLSSAVPVDGADLDDDADLEELSPVDLGEQPRITDDRTAADRGCGGGAIVDIGAFERPGEMPVPGDLDGDGLVGLTDLLVLLSGWGTCGTCCVADLNRDGSVGFLDLIALLSDWS